MLLKALAILLLILIGIVILISCEIFVRYSDPSSRESKTMARMTTDEMIAFWSRLGGGTVHPEDDAALLRANGFETRTLPQPWTGPIKSARAFVALWNPGLDPRDVPYEASNATFCKDLRSNLQGNAPSVFFDPKYQNHSGAEWAARKFGDDRFEIGGTRICIIELVAYHRVDSTASRKVFHHLRSTAVMKAWVHDTLLPRVRAGDACLVVGMAVSQFGVGAERETPNFVRYQNPECRLALMTAKTRGGRALRRCLSMPGF
jgi:hypothetical protein